MSAATRVRSRRPGIPDRICAEAKELALAAAEDVAGIGNVGEHLGVEADDDRVLTHLFECKDPGYQGWRWAVTVARAPRAKLVTVDETVLLPGPDALLAPEWVPWSERLRPGDLGIGDLLPTREDDERLAPGYTASDEGAPHTTAELTDIGWELGLGRRRVLSPHGREEVADRWYAGTVGPSAPVARAAPAHCSTCGFLVPLSGPLGQMFGACANEYSPDDGQVVSFDHGCGAHSEAAVTPATPPLAPPIVDEFQYDTLPAPPEDQRPAGKNDRRE